MRQRLIVLHLLAILAATVILPLSLYWRVNESARALHQRALRDHADEIGSYLKRAVDGRWSLAMPEPMRALYGTAYGRYEFAVVTAANQALLSSTQPPAPLFRAIPRGSTATYVERRIDGAMMFGASVPITVGGERVWVDILEDEAHRDVLIDDIVAEFLPSAALIVIPILLVLLSADLIIFERALKPLMLASRLAGRIGPAHTDVRLPEHGMPRELLPLVRGVNQALDRLQAGLMRQREFVADAAHELRTPLAVLRARAEALETRETARPLIADIDAMARIIGQLLDVADSDALTVGADEAADLAAVATEVASFLAPVAVAERKDIAVYGAARPVWVVGSGPALFRATRNLVENAIRHTAPGTTVEIAVGTDGTLAVSDAGPGVPAAERALIFQRFWRGDRSRHGSAGLGLAIVDRIARAHGGTASVADAPGGGAVFTLHLRPAPVDADHQTRSIPAP